MNAAVTTPAERGMPFGPEMVRKILADEKTNTRRVCTKAITPNGYRFDRETGEIACHNDFLPPDAMLMHVRKGKDSYVTSNYEGWERECPHGGPGDKLWVRESVRHVGGGRSIYVADNAPTALTSWPWKVKTLIGRYCPRELSRITLEITDVRVQRLQEISGEDARAEGITVPRCSCEVCMRSSTMCPADASEHIMAFAELWRSINDGRPGCSWDANPYVWAIGFKRIEARP